MRHNIPGNRLTLPLLVLVILSVPAAVQAHPGHAFAGLDAGFVHPLTGWDHLLAMLGVGMWAAQWSGRARWILPSAFAGAMLIGGSVGMSGLPLPWAEQGVVASVFVLGLLVASSCRPRLGIAVAMVAAFAVFHGYAHGAELPAAGGRFGYACGFLAATVMLNAMGLGLAQLMKRNTGSVPWLRFAGGGLALAGLALGIH